MGNRRLPPVPRVRAQVRVLSDIHIREGGKTERCYGGDVTYFRKALEYFRGQGVDAVMIGGVLCGIA